ncbi:uncharacterized protein LOC114263519 isoform X2 [Camellia sinensis]|uniref:uncharacterized protein LOC114263519 isoform X2 n=1 Tax=Camellia sinensis TaxID=4442 RepID=UPI0010356C75|nr:uncharacterized protein LOC114263519 isoform X2 [Camellia sinensis]
MAIELSSSLLQMDSHTVLRACATVVVAGAVVMMMVIAKDIRQQSWLGDYREKMEILREREGSSDRLKYTSSMGVDLCSAKWTLRRVFFLSWYPAISSSDIFDLRVVNLVGADYFVTDLDSKVLKI